MCCRLHALWGKFTKWKKTAPKITYLRISRLGSLLDPHYSPHFSQRVLEICACVCGGGVRMALSQMKLYSVVQRAVLGFREGTQNSLQLFSALKTDNFANKYNGHGAELLAKGSRLPFVKLCFADHRLVNTRTVLKFKWNNTIINCGVAHR